MNAPKKRMWFSIFLLLTPIVLSAKTPKKTPAQWSYGKNHALTLENKIKQEGFFSRNASLLNSNNAPNNKTVIPGKFTWDGKLSHTFYNEECGWDNMKAVVGLRAKGVYGAPEAGYSTDHENIRLDEAFIGKHQHNLNVHVPVVRELWVEVALNEWLDLGYTNLHTFKAGLFPFSIGRGIAFGDAFATTPDFIGYDPASSVEQYAPGFKFSGELTDALEYDVYAEIADNKSHSFKTVNKKVKGQFYGHRFDQARGFGELNYITAARLRWTPIDNKCNMIYLEPYGLFNDEREQKLERRGDAHTRLGTFGLMMEGSHSDLEYGFEFAFNTGKQYVSGLDRNTIVVENRDDDGVLTLVNSHVIDTNDEKKAVYSEANQDYINTAIDQSLEDSTLKNLNGEDISGSPGLQHTTNRFRDPYTNRLRGWMGVFDMAYTFCDGDAKVAFATGYASGDENPNKDLNSYGESDIDGEYKGFISLQELYSGKRVRSAFLLSGKGKIPRILSFPSENAGGHPDQTSRFSNIAFVGSALWWTIEGADSSWDINPNILTYWQAHRSRIWDEEASERGETFASRHLGTEFNLHVDAHVLPGMKVFMVGGLFKPGRHFDDVKGRPLNKAQSKVLGNPDRTGVTVDKNPTLGNDKAFFINGGIEYKF